MTESPSDDTAGCTSSPESQPLKPPPPDDDVIVTASSDVITSSDDVSVSPPDGGWGWVIVGGCMVYFILAQGMSNSFGVYFIALREKFGGTAAQIAWVNALYNTNRMVAGPIASHLCKRFGIRPVIIVGGLMMSLGCVISSFATSLLHLYLSYGVITGVGGALVYAPMFVAISLYFDKNKGKAMALGTLGDGLGALTMAPLARVLLDEYGFSGAILIIGGLMLHNCTAGGLVRPVPTSSAPTVALTVNGDAGKTGEGSDKIRSNLPPADGTTTIYAREECTTNSGGTTTSGKRFCGVGRLRRAVRTSTFVSLLKTSTFICYCFSIMSLPFTGQLIYMALPSLARERGLSKTEGAVIVSLMGAGDMVGRFGCGFLYDMKRFRRRRSLLYGSFGIAIGVVSIIFGLQTQMAGFVIVGALWGVLLGGFHGQRATVITEFIPQSKLADSVGIMTFFQGLGSLSANTTGGMLADYFGTFSVCALYGGLVTIITSTLFLSDWLIQRHRRQSRTKS